MSNLSVSQFATKEDYDAAVELTVKTECLGEDCPIRDDCSRYTVKPDDYYFTQSPILFGNCAWYEPLDKEITKQA